MPLVVRAFPVLPGKEEQLRSFAHALETTRAAEAQAFHARLGVARESWHVQQTVNGTWVIGVTEIRDTPVQVAAQRYSESREQFERWFKDQLRQVTGIDADRTPLGPPTECIFDTKGEIGKA